MTFRKERFIKMQYGDLSNKQGPAILINADLLFEENNKWFGLKKNLRLLIQNSRLLDFWFSKKDLYVVIVVSGDYLKHYDKIQQQLDEFMVPYSKLIKVEYSFYLGNLLMYDFVLGYFYHKKENELVNERYNKEKRYQVMNLAEINYILQGGTYSG